MPFRVEKRKRTIHSSKYILDSYDMDQLIGFRNHPYRFFMEDVIEDVPLYYNTLNRPVNAFFDIASTYDIIDQMEQLSATMINIEYEENNKDDEMENISAPIAAVVDRSLLCCFEMLYYFIEDLSPSIIAICICSFHEMAGDIPNKKPIIPQFKSSDFAKHSCSLSRKWKRLLYEFYVNEFDHIEFLRSIEPEMNYFYKISRDIYDHFLYSSTTFHLDRCISLIEASTCKYRNAYRAIVTYYDLFFTFNKMKELNQ